MLKIRVRRSENGCRRKARYRSFTTLDLAPLSAENCRELIGEVFRGRLDAEEISARDLLKLHSATGGNPYFVVETLRLLINERVVEKISSGNGSRRWRWRGIADIPLPETVRMAARAKLFNLSAGARRLIDCAAVLGDAFQIETLIPMCQSLDENLREETIEAELEEASRAQILTEQNVAGADDCQFYHTTLRRAVYMDLSPRRRRRLHLRAAAAIEQAHLGADERFAAALAAHYENGGDLAASFGRNTTACRAAVLRFDWSEAAELLGRAERVESQIPDAEKISGRDFLQFQSLRGEIYMSVGRRVEAEKILAAAAFAEKTVHETDSPNILLNLGRTRILLGKYREAIPVLEKALRLAKNKTLASAVEIQIASAKYALCKYEESSQILQKIIDCDDEKSYNRAVALGKLGWTRALQSRYAEGKILLEEALEFHRTAGDMRERAVLAMCLNACEYGLGNYEAAIDYAKQARNEAQIVGEPYNESVAMMRIAKARIAQGLYREAEKLLESVWEKQKNLDAAEEQIKKIMVLVSNDRMLFIEMLKSGIGK